MVLKAVPTQKGVGDTRDRRPTTDLTVISGAPALTSLRRARRAERARPSRKHPGEPPRRTDARGIVEYP